MSHDSRNTTLLYYVANNDESTLMTNTVFRAIPINAGRDGIEEPEAGWKEVYQESERTNPGTYTVKQEDATRRTRSTGPGRIHRRHTRSRNTYRNEAHDDVATLGYVWEEGPT